MSRFFWLLFLLVTVSGAPAAPGVVVSPHAVYIDHQVRSGAVLLYNPNAEPAEVTMSLLFGYPVTDSTGQMVLRTVEQPDSSMPSAAGWIQAFPQRVTIAPLERQAVRLLARPPSGLPDGEYWARLLVSVVGGRPPIATAIDTAAVQASVTLEVRTIIGLNYRKGKVQAGLALSNLRARVRGDSLEVWSRLERQGNASYMGTVSGTLVDASGQTRGEFSRPIGVYYAVEPRFVTAVGRLAPGRYWLKLSVASGRGDFPREASLPAPTVRDSVEIQVP